MKLPVIKNRNKYKRRIVAFGGINYTQNFTEGELSDASGISHENFPALSQPCCSELFFRCENPSAAHYSHQLCVVADDGVYYDGKKVGELSPGRKMIAEMGNRVIIYPDKVYYDVEKNKIVDMESKVRIKGSRVSYTQTALAIKESVYSVETITESIVLSPESKVFKYTNVSVNDGKINRTGISVKKAEELAVEDYFYESSMTDRFRKVFSVSKTENGKILISGELTIVKNISESVFSDFRPGDTVEISGSKVQPETVEARVLEVSTHKLIFAEGTFKTGTEEADIVVKRKLPDFTSICVYENRFWGCSGKTLYGSKLGDPLEFYTYQGVSTDSFSVESNSEGDFTAITVYGNCCLLFKENKCYKLYGNKPANFSITESFGTGIAKGDIFSIVNINGQLFYKGNGGIYSFFGGIPQLISEKLGNILLQNCVGGAYRNCYYLSGETDGKRIEYVYDIQKGFWSKSGEENVNGYFSCGEDMYRFRENGVERLTSDYDCKKEWYAEFCPFSENYHNVKNYSRIYITAKLYENSWIKVEVSRDGEAWQTVCVKYGDSKEYISIPCPVKHCHELKLRLSGKGKSVIESVVREFSVN